jgi:hypothetical protein
MRRVVLAALCAGTLSSWVGIAQAATVNLDLNANNVLLQGDHFNEYINTFANGPDTNLGGSSFSLTLHVGDQVNLKLNLTNGAFTLPGNAPNPLNPNVPDQFDDIGFFLGPNPFGPAGAAGDTLITETTTIYDGAMTVGQNGFNDWNAFNILQAYARLSGPRGPITFDSIISNFTVKELAGSTDPSTSVTYNFAGAFADQSAPASVPEPATWAMLLLGFGLAGGALRRRGVALTA